MTQGELIALIAARPAGFAWLIGAGASRMSGLPTANDIVADLKRQYYAQEEGVEISLQDMHNDAVRERIQTFMDARGFPAQWSAEEYSGYFDKIFGADKERQRSYISRKLSEDKVNLSAGNRVQAAMLAAGLTRVIFTTNFDPVLERAYADVSGRSLSTYHLEGPHAALQALNEENYPLYVKLHGDFRYDSIKNLTADLAAQNDDLSKCLVAAASRFGLVVAGYSGRDESILALIREAMDQPNPFPAGLFWTSIQGASVLPSVRSLINDAQSKNIRSGVIEIETYDTLMLRIWRNLEDKPASLDAKVRRSASSMVSIPLPASKGGSPLVRMNALPVRALPTEALAVTTRHPKDWKMLREVQRNAASRIVLTKGEQIMAWGNLQAVQGAFGDGFVSAAPVSLSMTADGPDELHVQGFLEEGLVWALARGRPLVARSSRHGSVLIADRNPRDPTGLAPVKAKVGNVAGPIPRLMTSVTDEHPKAEPLFFAECLHISLSWKDGKCWLLVNPDIWVWPPRGRELASGFLDQRRRGRFNGKHNDLMDAWIDVLFGGRTEPIDARFALNDERQPGANASFEIGSQTAFSRRHLI